MGSKQLKVVQNDKDDEDFGKMLQKLQKPLIRYFYWNTKDYDDALDLFQEVSLKVIKNIDSFRNESTLSTWIYRIAYNTLIEFHRTKKRKKEVLFTKEEMVLFFPDNSKSIESRYLEQESLSEIWESVETLPKKYKQVFILKEMFDLKAKEISDILGIKLNTVLTRLHRAQDKLIRLLNPSSF